MKNDSNEYGYDPDPLNEKIIDDLGVDVSRYRSEELFLTLSEMIVFYEYIGTWVLPAVLVAFGMYITGFFVIDIESWEYLIYGVFGLPLSVILGLIIGLFLLTIKLKHDIGTITTQSLGIMANMIRDADKVKKENPGRSQKEIFNILFEGVMMVVMLPTTIAVMREKIPLGFRLFDSTVVKSFRIISKKVNFKKFDKASKSSGIVQSDPDSLAAKFGSMLPKAEQKIMSTVGAAINIARIPLLTGITLLSLIATALIYLIDK
jgi:hypothetical protein